MEKRGARLCYHPERIATKQIPIRLAFISFIHHLLQDFKSIYFVHLLSTWLELDWNSIVVPFQAQKFLSFSSFLFVFCLEPSIVQWLVKQAHRVHCSVAAIGFNQNTE